MRNSDWRKCNEIKCFPGESIKIRLHLSPGYEENAHKDRFLVLYAKKEDGSEDMLEFWKSHSSKEQHYEYRY